MLRQPQQALCVKEPGRYICCRIFQQQRENIRLKGVQQPARVCPGTGCKGGRRLVIRIGGIIKIREIVEILQSIGFDGFYSIEHYGAEDMFDYMQKSVDWLYKFN